MEYYLESRSSLFKHPVNDNPISNYFVLVSCFSGFLTALVT